ncbi:MAG: DNA polymerase III subunit alpha [Desulfobulbaceae bacterium]|jgi:DNA polymerase-3 subunit alpha|nr:DNA polymerase III subunit alpha [Desulfobulbaceae bacterium]
MTEPNAAPMVHLHVHSHYSMLDGAIRIDDLLARCREFNMGAVALTDHGAMFGALEFYDKARKAGIKPIIGCEFYVAAKSRFKKDQKAGHNFHIVLLAMDSTGYRNLLKLASAAQTEGFYYRPRIDYQLLAEHQEGLIVLTACLHGEIPWRLAHNDREGAVKKALELRGIFGDRLYLELQENGIAEQKIVNQGLLELGKELGIKVVGTNDCHYLNRDESFAHEVLLCIQTGKTISDTRRFRFSTDELYFKSPADMARQFSYCPEALANTLEVAERCNLELEFGRHYFPNFPVPAGETLESLFAKTCEEGLARRMAHKQQLGVLNPDDLKIYRDRLTLEIDVIQKMGFAGYFLIVADFINWAKEQQIPVGPGRGSGAGSLAAYCMQITDIDPIPYGLLFERFLNVERMSMPDFDVDFCKDRRDEVISYVRSKYGGDEHVAQIVAYGSMKARAAIRDVGRVLEIPLPKVDRIAKLVPEELKITLDMAIDKEPRLREAMKEDDIRQLLQIARTLEGLSRHKTIHAAGVVISPTPMIDYLPLCIGQNREVLTQYDMKYTEKTGLIKFDFLGLKTLTVIDRALKLIRQDIGTDIQLDSIPMDDPKTYHLLCRADSLGVFQLESDGMRNLLKKMQPELFTDLIALVALYRPGPLDSGMVDTFVETKHGRRPPEYPLPQLKEILEETYGVIVYQEQVMKIANVLAGYSLGDADILRRAMGKKIPEVMEKEREKFMAGALRNGIPEKKATYIFDLMAKFAGYGFNKSHSAAYALVSYQTAYLKAHYPAQYMAALLSCDKDNTDKVVKYINECRQHNIAVLPPDINESFQDFTVVNDRIRFGLAAVKNVGTSALASIIEERESNGQYTSLSDFCGRIDSSRVNRKVIESLIKAGAFDSMNCRRSQLMMALDEALEKAKAAQRDRLSGQMSLFALGAGEEGFSPGDVQLPDIPEWPKLKKLSLEKETLGFFLTGHPLEGIIKELRIVADTDIERLDQCIEGQAVRLGGLVQNYRELKSKKGERMAFAVLEDMTSSVEIIIFPGVFAQCSHLLDTEEPVVVLGRVQHGERGAKIIAESLELLPAALEKYTREVIIHVRARQTSRHHLEQLKEMLYHHHGACPVRLTLQFDGRGEVDVEILKDLKIRPSAEFFRQVENTLGYPALIIRTKEPEITNNRKKGFGEYNRETLH